MKSRLSFGIIFISLLCGGCKKPPEPEKPLVMTLKLAKHAWHVGDSPWYLLQVKNVGHKERHLDAFWFDQTKMDTNSDYRAVHGVRPHDTYFEIRTPDGKLMTPDCMAAWGMHGEFKFWTNKEAGPEASPLKPGQMMTAMPSVVVPVRMERRDRTGPADARIPPNATPEERKSYAELWKQYKGELADGGRANDYTLDPKILYPGYRILECYFFNRPGIYQMKAIMDERLHPTALSADEEIEDLRKNLFLREPSESIKRKVRKEWAAMTPQQLEQKKKTRALEDGWAQKDPGFYIESNTVEVEALP